MALAARSVQLRAPVRAPARRARVAGRCSAVAVRASAARDDAAKSAVVGALVATLAGVPLFEAAPAYAAVASADTIAAAEKEGAARLASCTTNECRQVIEALNQKKLAKLRGTCPGETAPSVRAVAPPKKQAAKELGAPAAPKPAPVAPRLAPAPAPRPAAAAAPSASPSSSSSSAAAAAKAAADKRAAAAAVKAAADKKAAAAKAAAEAKRKAEERKRKSGGTNPLFYTIGFVGKFAFAAGALAAPFIYLKKEEVIVDEAGAIDTEKAIKTVSSLADTVPNKEVVAAYGIGALVALGIVDGIINLPLLNIFIGAPVQVLGFVSALALAVRYFSEGKAPADDAKALAVTLNELVPESLPKPLPADLLAKWK